LSVCWLNHHAPFNNINDIKFFTSLLAFGSHGERCHTLRGCERFTDVADILNILEIWL
jgi:hypothetical protein